MIADKLQEHYAALSAKEAAEREKVLGPSSFGDCIRKLAFLVKGDMEPYPPSPESYRVFQLGHQRGDELERIAKELWTDAITQVPVEIACGKHTIKGTADLYIPSLATVVDFKTIGSFGAGLLAKEGPKDDYVLQVHAYRDAIAKARGLDPKGVKGVLVYECKDSDARKGVKAGQLIECDVPWTADAEFALKTRLSLLERMLDEKESGELDPLAWTGLPKTHWKCRCDGDGRPLYCSIGPWRGQCHEAPQPRPKLL